MYIILIGISMDILYHKTRHSYIYKCFAGVTIAGQNGWTDWAEIFVDTHG